MGKQEAWQVYSEIVEGRYQFIASRRTSTTSPSNRADREYFGSYVSEYTVAEIICKVLNSQMKHVS